MLAPRKSELYGRMRQFDAGTGCADVFDNPGPRDANLKAQSCQRLVGDVCCEVDSRFFVFCVCDGMQTVRVFVRWSWDVRAFAAIRKAIACDG